MKYDVFISYRRGNGFFLAQIIKEYLAKRKINSFLDVEELHSGKFDKEIIDAINDSPNFILILTKGALEKCIDEQDWMRREITEAISHNKNIIPIMYDDFKWPKKWPDKMPDIIRNLEMYQAVIGSKVYLSAMVDKIISYMSGVDIVVDGVQEAKNHDSISIKGTLHMATSGLTVVDSIIQGWNCDSIFREYGYNIEKHPYKWSDRILEDMQKGLLDIAIYNKESCVSFNNKGGNIHIIRDVCSSMGGRNFYILASKQGKWKGLTLEQFKNAIDNTTVIGIPKNSDMYKNLLFVLDMTEDEIHARGVKFIDYHTEQGLELFNVIPDLLIIGGQDIRFLAECNGGFFELISYDYFSKDKKDYFYKNSINSLLISPAAMKKITNVDIEQLSMDLMLSFYKNFMKKESINKIYNILSNKLSYICTNKETLKYIVSKIIFETYRIII